jgi:hypothetical protein
METATPTSTTTSSAFELDKYQIVHPTLQIKRKGMKMLLIAFNSPLRQIGL